MNTARFNTRPTRRRRAISLLEVAVVSVVIGVLASLSMPSFHRGLEQSRADVAGANLRAIWTAQRLYWLEYRTYTSDLSTLISLDLLDPGIPNQSHYYYQIEWADAEGFSASAIRVANGRWNGTLSIDAGGAATGYLTAAGEGAISPSY